MLVSHVHNKCGHERLMLSPVKILCNGDGGGGGGEMGHVWVQDKNLCKFLAKISTHLTGSWEDTEGPSLKI